MNGFSAQNVSVIFRSGGLLGGESHMALRGITLAIPEGSCFGIIGESGSGKSTFARVLAGLISPTHGMASFMDVPASLSPAYHRKVQMVFQDPVSSLNPRLRICDSLALPLRALAGMGDRKRIRRESLRLLDEVGVAGSALTRYPHEFSGGQAQRIAIARALAAAPCGLILDEAVSALDVSVQAQTLLLLKSLRTHRKLTMAFISHDPDVIREMCDSVATIHRGKLVEKDARSRESTNPQPDSRNTDGGSDKSGD
jgi:peptide/nickel transport system ATP-binding protein